MTFSAAIFDLDGTLIDSMGLWETIDEIFFAERKMPVPKGYFEAVAHMSMQETAQYTAALLQNKETPEALMAEWQRLALDQYRHCIALKPGVKAYLSYLKAHQVPMAIATSSPKILYEAVLARHGISPFFTAICSTEDTGIGKDRPDIFLLTAEKLGCAPSGAIVFEDLLQGVSSALKAGMQVYGVYDAHAENQKEAIKKIATGYITDFSQAPRPF